MNRTIKNSRNSSYVIQVSRGLCKILNLRSLIFYLCDGKRAWSRRAKSVRKYFVLFFSCGASFLRGKAELPSHSKEYLEQREKAWFENIQNIEQFKDYAIPDFKGKFTAVNLADSVQHQLQIATLIQNLSH
jgi:hypothetical protein